MDRDFFDKKMVEMDIIFRTNVHENIKEATFKTLCKKFTNKDFDTACRGVTLGETKPPNAFTFLEYKPVSKQGGN